MGSLNASGQAPPVGPCAGYAPNLRRGQSAETNPVEAFADVFAREGDHRFEELLTVLPAAIYTTDMDGRITFYNDMAVELAGRRPNVGDRWCVTWKLYHPDGRPMPHEECPMAIALREKRPVFGHEAIAERPDGTRIWFTPYPMPLRDSNGVMTGAINMLVDISFRKEAELQQKLMMDELNHRVKNTLATIQSLLAQSARSATTVEDYHKTVEGRMLAMSRAHDQLSRRNWKNAELGELLRSVLSPYARGDNILFSGEPVHLPPRAALSLSMAFHELATNAERFGALSTSQGKVDVRWDVERKDTQRLLRLNWTEKFGPQVEPILKRGFGVRFLERGIQAELRGKTAVEFPPSGVNCAMEIPLANVE